MAAISKSYTNILNASVDPDAPLLSSLMYALRDNIIHNREWLGASFTAGAVQDHNHDGVNSALVEVGGNLLRNGSFESSSNGWTLTNYTGGASAVQTTGAMHGKYCLALTSTVLANGGGYATSNEFLPCAPARNYFAQALLKASVANVSSKIEVIWYDSAQAQISVSTLYSSSNTPTSATLCGSGITSPANTAYAKVRVTGGVPATGSATGTVYVDGVVANNFDLLVSSNSVGAGYLFAPSTTGNESTTTTSTTPVEALNAVITASGIYRVSYELRDSIPSTTPQAAYGKIYRNGAAYGTLQSSHGTYVQKTEDLYFEQGDTIQVFAYVYPGVGASSQVRNLGVGVGSVKSLHSNPIISLPLGVR